MSSNIAVARKLALHMHQHGDDFYLSMDEFFRTAVLARALNDYGIPVLQHRCSWKTKTEELGDGIIHGLEIDAHIMGVGGELGWRNAAMAQLPSAALSRGFGRLNPADTVRDAITSYAKANSSFFHDLIVSAAGATAWLQAQSLDVSTPQVTSQRNSGHRL